MILSSSFHVDHVSTFMPSSSKGLRPLNQSSRPSTVEENPMEKPSDAINKIQKAIKDLNLKQDGPKSSQPTSTSVTRALQPVDVNLSKADRHHASSSRSEATAPPSPKLLASRPVSRKNRSPSSKDLTARCRAGKKSLSIVCSSSDPLRAGERISIKVPQKLPAPRIKPNSSPYEDLVGHLARHHLFSESQSVVEISISPDFFLTKYLEMAHLGKCSLYHQTSNFLEANRDVISDYVKPGELLPDAVPLDITELVAGLQVAPTHLLVVYSDTQGATLYAVHGVVLALQCVSIPFLPASNTRQEGSRLVLDMPTLALRVPAPEQFSTILRWLYSQSPTSLLQELLPLKHITTHLARRKLSQAKSVGHTEIDESGDVNISKLAATDLVEAMSTLSTRSFLERLQTIQLVWKNGAALGIVSWGFWNQLNSAWNLLISAMAASKKKSHKKMVAVAAATASELSSQLQTARIQ